jgi:hypothetical protein
MGPRKYLVGVLAFGLAIWGPLDAWGGLPFRIFYLIAIPTAAWFVLRWIWSVWRPDAATESRLSDTLAGATAGIFLVGAVLAARSDHHFDCTQGVQTRDGYECVGDYVRVPGPDLGEAVMFVVGAGFAFWFGVMSPPAK